MDDDESGLISFAEFEPWWQANGGKALKKQAASGAIDMRECKGVWTEDMYSSKRMHIVLWLVVPLSTPR